MKLTNLILPLVALGTAAVLLTPGASEGYSLIGGSLSQSQRDIRTFNNFTDASANDNQTPDANFPGHQGAVMAIWKAGIEWGSELHGNGDGDPHQPFGLGSGGANFDPSMQGSATGVGGTNDNIHSGLSGGSGGVLAFTETPISNGWRIRYYESWTWADGPGTSIPGSQIDLQGVACHEYGHALGLGHSTVGGAVMYPSISGTGVVTRSIENDDIAGIKAVYGVAAANKPHISGYSVTGNTLTVTGTGFDGTGNEVWFTQASAGGTGNPIKVTGLSSSGTSITASIPGGAGPGDILVRRNSTAHSGLSNAFPYNGTGGGGPTCGITLIGVGAGGANIGSLNTADSPVLGQTVNLVASGFNGTSAGTLILSFGAQTTPILGGTIFINYLNPVAKLPIAISGGLGIFPLMLPLTPSLAYLSGYAQVGTFDPTQTQSWAFSNAMELTFCP
jgi:hypothetical protein